MFYQLCIFGFMVALTVSDNNVPDFVHHGQALKDASFVCRTEDTRQNLVKCAKAAPHFDKCLYQCAKPAWGLPHLSGDALCKNDQTKINVINCIANCVKCENQDDKEQVAGFHSCIGIRLSALQIDNFCRALFDFKRRFNI